MRLRNPWAKDKEPAKEYTTIEYPHYGEIKQDYDPDDPTAVSQYRQGRQVLVHGVEGTPKENRQYHRLATKPPTKKSYVELERYRQKTYGKQIKSPEGFVHKSAWGIELFAA